MDGWMLALLAAAVIVAGLIWSQVRLHWYLAAVHREATGLSAVNGQISELREQVRASLEGGQHAIDRRLEETNRVVGDVRRELGEVDRQTRHVAEAARDLRGLQDLMRSPKLRGGIGEYLLAELLAQVLPQSQFSLQHAFRSGDRVDAVIHVGDRLVPIDAKFPLENFRRLANAETDSGERAARRAFVADLKRHVDAIAGRYVRPDERTFEFALMYIPAEAIYHEALLTDKDDGDALQYALSRKVIPVSPQSFYAYLQVIVMGLRGLSIEQHTREIVDRLASIRVRLDQFGESFELVARHLTNAQKQVDEARRRLERLDIALGEGIETENTTGLGAGTQRLD